MPALFSARTARPIAPPAISVRRKLPGAVVKPRAVYAAANAPRSNYDSNDTPEVFQQVEGLIISNFNTEHPGGRLDWKKVKDCWVLRPPPSAGPPEAVVLFVGGAFVGAAPEIAYKLFLETLAARNIMVVAVPYETSFDHQRITDDLQYKSDACLKAIAPEVRGLPVYGVGHSLGSVLTLMLNSRFAVHRDGNALISFNNRPATDVIPFLSPFLAPGTRALGPILSQMATSPLRTTLDSALDTLRSMSPNAVKMSLPLLEQLSPVFMDVAQGRQEFSPSPEESDRLIRTYYAVSRNLLIRFKDDTIDETARLTTMLQREAAISGNMDLTLRTLPGDHLRPMAQNIVDLPPDVARFANNTIKGGGQFIGSLSNMAQEMGFEQAQGPLKDLGRQVENMSSVVGGTTGGPITDGAQSLADEVAAWMGVGNVVSRGGRALPAPQPKPAAF